MVNNVGNTQKRVETLHQHCVHDDNTDVNFTNYTYNHIQ